MGGWAHGWVNGWVNGWITIRGNGWTTGWVNWWTTGWVNEWITERGNGWTPGWIRSPDSEVDTDYSANERWMIDLVIITFHLPSKQIMINTWPTE